MGCKYRKLFWKCKMFWTPRQHGIDRMLGIEGDRLPLRSSMMGAGIDAAMDFNDIGVGEVEICNEKCLFSFYMFANTRIFACLYLIQTTLLLKI